MPAASMKAPNPNLNLVDITLRRCAQDDTRHTQDDTRHTIGTSYMLSSSLEYDDEICIRGITMTWHNERLKSALDNRRCRLTRQNKLHVTKPSRMLFTTVTYLSLGKCCSTKAGLVRIHRSSDDMNLDRRSFQQPNRCVGDIRICRQSR